MIWTIVVSQSQFQATVAHNSPSMTHLCTLYAELESYLYFLYLSQFLGWEVPLPKDLRFQHAQSAYKSLFNVSRRCEFLKRQGKDRLKALLARTAPSLRYQIDTIFFECMKYVKWNLWAYLATWPKFFATWIFCASIHNCRIQSNGGTTKQHHNSPCLLFLANTLPWLILSLKCLWWNILYCQNEEVWIIWRSSLSKNYYRDYCK